jgi:hypothetical protein
MALIPIPVEKQRLIVKNVLAACSDIERLNGTGYGFLYLASGFIAHYNINGFKAFYTDMDLRTDILSNEKANMWYNFRPSDSNYAYYMAKRDVYLAILRGL